MIRLGVGILEKVVRHVLEERQGYSVRTHDASQGQDQQLCQHYFFHRSTVIGEKEVLPLFPLKKRFDLSILLAFSASAAISLGAC